MKKILLALGTRPEVIKLAPIIAEFSARNIREQLYVVNTNQHRDFVSNDLNDFGIHADHTFELQRDSGDLTLLNGLLLLEFYRLKEKLRNQNVECEAVIAQGDTATTFSAAQFAFYSRIPFFHIEAGLRTNDFSQPFPEEFLRHTISRIAALHFAPTATAKNNLLSEGVASEKIVVSGNTSIDNIRTLRSAIDASPDEKNIVLITIHRRENMQSRISDIATRIQELCRANTTKSFVWIENAGYKIAPHLSVTPLNLKVIPPVSFVQMKELYTQCGLIITDSGGIQEEAAFLGIPVIVFRDKTEREDGMAAGISVYIDQIDDDLTQAISAMKAQFSPASRIVYGDGKATLRIVDFICNYMRAEKRSEITAG